MALTGCSGSGVSADISADTTTDSLRHEIEAIAAEYPAEIGVALITDSGDTLTVNNNVRYQLMSVFKLHQAIALCDMLERSGKSLDSTVRIERRKLNPDTWSPMLKEHPESNIEISLRELLRYTLTMSDNNASDYLFDHVQPVTATDSFIATVIPRECFRLEVTETEMFVDHERSNDNHSSPLGAALLIERLFTDSIIGNENARYLRTTLGECATGIDRISTPLTNIPDVKVAHKTGSGYSDGGVLAAHNDVAFITLPDGRHYTLAVLVKNFHGDETQASTAISRISAAVAEWLGVKPKDEKQQGR